MRYYYEAEVIKNGVKQTHTIHPRRRLVEEAKSMCETLGAELIAIYDILPGGERSLRWDKVNGVWFRGKNFGD